jgi:hypothetical protein
VRDVASAKWLKIALLFLPTRAINGHGRNPVRRNEMNTTTESEKNTSAPEVQQPKANRAPAKKAKPAKKGVQAKKPDGRPDKPRADRANKKAEVIARRDAGGHHGPPGGRRTRCVDSSASWAARREKIDSSKNASGERTYKIGK